MHVYYIVEGELCSTKTIYYSNFDYIITKCIQTKNCSFSSMNRPLFYFNLDWVTWNTLDDIWNIAKFCLIITCNILHENILQHHIEIDVIYYFSATM